MFEPEFLLNTKDVTKYFRGKQGGVNEAVFKVSLELRKGETAGLVGESGSGKTTFGRMAVGLVSPSKGKIMVAGSLIDKMKDKEKFKQAQYIHQDPYGSLDPYSTVGAILERPLRFLLGMNNREELRQRASEMLRLCGLNDGYYDKTIQELSGGEKQRVLIARAFIVNPRLVVEDEPTTMIDFVHRDEVLNLIVNLKDRLGLSVLLITHDVSLATKVSQQLFIMYRGRIVESGPTGEVVGNPLHPYTKLLMSVSPESLVKDPEKVHEFMPKAGMSSRVVRNACMYSLNCPFAFATCRQKEPELREENGHKVACFLY